MPGDFNSRHYVGGDTNYPGCDGGEVVAQTVGYREGLRTLAKGINERIALAATVDADELRELLAPYLEDSADYAEIPRTTITPFGTPDHLYPRSACAINEKYLEEAKRG